MSALLFWVILFKNFLFQIPPFAGEDTSSELWRCYQETQGVPTLTICKEEFTLAETLQDVTNQLQAFESNSKDFDDFVNELAEKE